MLTVRVGSPDGERVTGDSVALGSPSTTCKGLSNLWLQAPKAARWLVLLDSMELPEVERPSLLSDEKLCGDHKHDGGVGGMMLVMYSRRPGK